MSIYQDAAHEAFRRLKYAETHRPSDDEMAAWKKAQKEADRKAKISRLRQRIA